MRYVVTAPYINVRIGDPVSGKWVFRGFHAGVIVPEGVHEDDIAKHLRKTMIAPLDEPAPAVEEPVETPVEEPSEAPAPKPARAKN